MSTGFDFAATPPPANFTVRKCTTTVAATAVQIAAPNQRRRWIALKANIDNATGVWILLTDSYPDLGSSPSMELDPGQTVVFSVTGDMPYQGGIYCWGAAPDSIIGIECSTFPYTY